MSHAELNRFEFLLRMAGDTFPHSNSMAVETRYDGGLEGLLIQGNRRSVAFQWQATSGDAFGVLSFAQKEGDLDLDWVRDVCQSLTCDENQLGEKEYSGKEMREMLEGIEIRRSDATGGPADIVPAK